MFEGLYNSASGMISQSFIQEIIAANIAKSVVPGYKKQTPVSESFETELSNYFKQVGGSKIKDIYTSFAQGNIKLTSNPLDVALTGGGFLVVENSTLEGSGNLYTRNGRLSINPDGVLVTLDGYPVLGEKRKNFH
ncbi:MAG: flagellar hook basal-body protein [bacterium]|nr:flagellar hook basal-body protein [bacterium]